MGLQPSLFGLGSALLGIGSLSRLCVDGANGLYSYTAASWGQIKVQPFAEIQPVCQQ